MTMLNPSLLGATALAEGPGWAAVRGLSQNALLVLRDDGVTMLGATMDRQTYSKATIIARVNASAGITAGEQARLALAAAAPGW